MIEVCYQPWYRKVHGAELSHQVLQLLPADAPLRGWDGEELLQFLKFSLRKGYCTGFCVDCPPQNSLPKGPVAFPRLDLLHAHGVLGFYGKGQGNYFEGPDRAIKDLTLSVWSPLYRYDHVINITLYMGEAIQGVRRARACIEDLGNGPVYRYRKRRVN